ncbi:MAG: family N-acetyltransferase [Chlamydiia bacterium]|nr:family N-acetyltransferase [Chlamydiia bacterium]
MYTCLQQNRFESSGIILLPLRLEDMESIRIWRNEQIDILRQNTPIAHDAQVDYFNTAIAPLFTENKPSQLLFSIFKKESLIGYGGLTHINWTARSAEISFLLNTSISEGSTEFAEIFRAFLEIMKEIAFTHLSLHRLHAETFAMRPHIPHLLESFGFEYEGCLRDYVFKRGTWYDSLLYGLLAKKKAGKGVLITSISKKVPLIQAVSKAVRKSDSFTTVFGADVNDAIIGKYFVDSFWQCPSLEKLRVDELIHFCKKNNIQAIIPTRDADLLFYSKHKQKLQENEISVMVSDLATIKSCHDKKAFADFLAAHTLPAIPTYLTLDKCAFPKLVVKERFGAGSRHIGINVTPQEAHPIAATLESPIFQPFVKGKEYSIDLYRDLEGSVKGVITRTRDLVQQGESQITTTIHKPKLQTLCVQLATLLNLYGAITIQVIESETDIFHIVECNPRFGGASTLSIAAGLDCFYWFLCEAEKKNLQKIPFQAIESPLQQIRYSIDRILT